MMMQKIPIVPRFEAAHLPALEHPAFLQPVILPKYSEIGRKKRPAVIICPGGGYDFCSEREGVPVGMRFAGYGVQTFVLWYHCRQPFPVAMMELAEAVAHVRRFAESYDVNPDRIAVMGFSAGAHLAGSLAVHWNHPVLTSLYSDSALYRPNAQILCYPVITAGEFAHRSSIVNLVGEENGNQYQNAEADMVSLEKQVSADTPPCFLWHTFDDDTVPVQNALLYLSALAAHGVPFESHIWPHGAHGLSFADETTAKGEWHLNPVCADWFTDCLAWIRRGFS